MSRLLSRLAALGLLLALPAALWLGAIRPALGALDRLEAEIALLEDQLARFERRISEGGRRAEIEIAEPALLAAADPSLAAAELQRRLDAAVTGAGGELRSLTVERPEPLGEAAMRIPVSLEATIGMDALAGLMHRIESGAPYLVIETARIRRLGRDDAARRLALSLRVAGVAPRAGE